MLGERPKGFQVAGCGMWDSETAALASGTHVAGTENCLLRPKLVSDQRGVKTYKYVRYFQPWCGRWDLRI